VSCPICQKRKAARFCPAKGEKICAVCCGTEREVSIDCPSDCSYLVAAHRYEDQHQRSLPGDTPLMDVKVAQEVIYTHQDLLSGLAFTAAKFSAAHPATSDPDVLASLEALAETYRTLSSGIFYERPPDARLARGLYAALAQFLDESKQQTATAAPGLAVTSNFSAANSPPPRNSSAKNPESLSRDDRVVIPRNGWWTSPAALRTNPGSSATQRRNHPASWSARGRSRRQTCLHFTPSTDFRPWSRE
jgi:hypothetical protein